MGLYVSNDEMKVRVNGKIRFTDDPDSEPDKMSNALLTKLINEAEAQVETDLSLRYSAPFQTKDCQGFDKLPRTTKQYLRTMCELLGIIRLMETDFGRSSAVDGSKYAENSQKRYDKMLEQQMKLKKDSYNTYIYPPLSDLRLNYQNEEADTGFKGRVLTSNTTDDGDFPSKQINDPSEDWFNGVIDE